MEKILYLRVECFRGMYPKHICWTEVIFTSIFGSDGYIDSASAIIEYLKIFNFSLISTQPGDYIFLNEKLKHKLLDHQVYLVNSRFEN